MGENSKISNNSFKINTTGLQTNFSGGTWGDDWQKNVKGKTVHLYNMVNELKEPLLIFLVLMTIFFCIKSIKKNNIVNFNEFKKLR